MRRAFVLGSALAAALALGGVGPALRDARPEAAFPSVAGLRRPVARPIRDRVLPAGGRAPLTLAGSYGGPYTTSTGETVKVFLSDRYQPDDARAQAWADLLAGFVHGEELASVTVYVAPLDEVHELCGGGDAVACYRSGDERVIVPGETPDPSVSIEQIAAHEYGHHIANSRSDAPWDAFQWGPKRWATYARICERAAAGTVFPGDEGDDYALNPGEGWAEAYRRLNEVRHSDWPVLPWDVVDPSFQPDAAGLQAVEQDVINPWLPTTSTWTGRFGRKGQKVVRRLSTRYDGLVIVSFGGPSGSVVRLLDAATRTVLDTTRSSFKYTSCGYRKFDLVATAGAKGRFTAQLLVP